MLTLLFATAFAAEVEVGPARWVGGTSDDSAALPGENHAAGTSGSVDLMDSQAWDEIPYPIGTELALAAADVGADQADVLTAATRSDLTALHRVHIDRVALGSGGTANLLRGGLPETCSPLGDVQWRGNDGVRTYDAGEDRTVDGEIAASVVLVRDHPDLGALVAVAPGDTVELHEVHRHGRVTRESMVIRRGESTLTFVHAGRSHRVCYSRGG